MKGIIEDFMKSQKEIEEKYDELNKRMVSLIPGEKEVQEMKNIMEKNIDSKSSLDIFVKQMERSSNSISTDAQRYILEWVLGQHN